uniref:Alternative protein PTPRS n=1 Tax=Homo sapiens TaxID=9606 RepID=L8E8Y3_HUMAN|nr:alternative protein PTPRS [Homo sapiens]
MPGMASPGLSGSSSSQTGRNRVCQSRGRASSTSLAKCIRLRSSLARTAPSLSTAVPAWAGRASSSRLASCWSGCGMKAWWTSFRR